MIDTGELVGSDAGGESGRHAPLRDVYASLAPRVRRLAARRVGEDLADDVVQETFLRAYRAYDRYVEDGRSWSWVRNIAEHVCIDLMRRSRIETAAVQRAGSYSRADAATSVIDLTLASVEAHEHRATLASVLEQLQPRQRRVLVLRDLHGWSTHEVADALGMTIDGVKATLKRARSSFRAVYAGVSGGRYVGGVITAIAAMRRALRRTSSALAGSMNTVLVGAIVVVTTLVLGVPVLPYLPDAGDAAGTSGSRLSDTSSAPAHLRVVSHIAGPSRRSAPAVTLPSPAAAFPAAGGHGDGSGTGVTPRAGTSLLPGDGAGGRVDQTGPTRTAEEPPTLEVETDISPTCGVLDLESTCAPLDTTVRMPLPQTDDTPPAPMSQPLPVPVPEVPMTTNMNTTTSTNTNTTRTSSMKMTVRPDVPETETAAVETTDAMVEPAPEIAEGSGGLLG